MSLSAGRSSSLQKDRYSRVSPPSFLTSTTSTDGATVKMSAATARRPLGPPRPAPSNRTPRAPLLVTRIRPPPRAATSSRRETTPLADSRVANRMPPSRCCPLLAEEPPSTSNRGERSNPAEREMRWNAFSVSGGSSLAAPAQTGSAGWSSSVAALTGLATDDLVNHGISTSWAIVMRHPRDEPARIRGQPRRAPVVAAAHLLKHGGDVVLGEREGASEENVEDDPARPDVGLGAVVALVPKHLRRDVPRRAAERVQQPVGAGVVGERAESEVDDLEVPGVVDEQVLGLEVAVEHPPRVAEVDGGDELPEVAPRDVLPDAAGAHDAGEELPAADELERQVYLGARGHHLVELDDVRV
nr:unnamed protein product [Digitaria exilis]